MELIEKSEARAIAVIKTQVVEGLQKLKVPDEQLFFTITATNDADIEIEFTFPKTETRPWRSTTIRFGYAPRQGEVLNCLHVDTDNGTSTHYYNEDSQTLAEDLRSFSAVVVAELAKEG